jgi:signal transduction histidine kinase
MTRGSLRLRLLFAGAISVIAAVALSAIGLVQLFERHVERRARAELSLYLNQVIAGVDRGADGTSVMSSRLADPRFTEPLSGLYWQVDTGNTTLRSRSLWDGTLTLPRGTTAGGVIHQHHIHGPNGTALIAVERSVTLPPSMGGGTMRAAVAEDASDVAAATRSFAIDLTPYLVLIAAFLIAASYAQIAVGLRPLTAVRGRLAAIREGKARRLGAGFPDEIVPLATELDALLGARETQLEKARARAGDLAHGLKTPLQVLVGDVDRLRAKGDTEIAMEIEQVVTAMRRHVDRELARARMAAGSRDARAVVAGVVQRVVAVVARTPAGARLDWSVDIPRQQSARIDPDDLAEAIGNLVENAARHARARVSIQTRRDSDFIVISVADDGSGMPPEQLESALARGGHFDQSGSGAGLGLAIVSDIAEAWNGRLEIRNGTVGLVADFFVPIVDPRMNTAAD